MRFRFVTALALCLAPLAVHAQSAATEGSGPAVMTEEEIRRDVTNATISGRYTFGGFFTEYHAADGRVLGHNGWTKNTDACWTTKAPNQICYSYGPADDRQTYCFVMERKGDALTCARRRITGSTASPSWSRAIRAIIRMAATPGPANRSSRACPETGFRRASLAALRGMCPRTAHVPRRHDRNEMPRVSPAFLPSFPE